MQLRLRFFATLRERAGVGETSFEIDRPVTVAELWDLVRGERPKLASYGGRVAFAVNEQYVDSKTTLQDNDEVAFIPPVSGGSARLPMFEIVEQPIDINRIVAAVGRPGAGAIATFIGTTRDHNAGRRVTRLEYEAYPAMAIREMRAIGAEATTRFSAQALAIVHRIGVVEIGEASVVIAVSASHRAAAFDACRFAIDRLKEIVPIWKKEHYEGGEIWIGAQQGGLGDRESVAS
jgi:molybdopterin synthase catalytic subunit